MTEPLHPIERGRPPAGGEGDPLGDLAGGLVAGGLADGPANERRGWLSRGCGVCFRLLHHSAERRDGYDAGTKTNGRKRDVIVDTMASCWS